MVKVFYSEHFRQRVRKLNEKEQNKLARLVVLLKKIRITRNYIPNLYLVDFLEFFHSV